MVKRLSEEKTVLVMPEELCSAVEDIADIINYLVDGGFLPEGNYIVTPICVL